MHKPSMPSSQAAVGTFMALDTYLWQSGYVHGKLHLIVLQRGHGQARTMPRDTGTAASPGGLTNSSLESSSCSSWTFSLPSGMVVSALDAPAEPMSSLVCCTQLHMRVHTHQLCHSAGCRAQSGHDLGMNVSCSSRPTSADFHPCHSAVLWAVGMQAQADSLVRQTASMLGQLAGAGAHPRGWTPLSGGWTPENGGWTPLSGGGGSPPA